MKTIKEINKKKFYKDNKDLINGMYQKMNLDAWAMLSCLNKCFYGCKKFNSPLYKETNSIGAKVLNSEYLLHIYQTHGLPPMMLVNMLANKLYKNEEDKEKMRRFYKFVDI